MPFFRVWRYKAVHRFQKKLYSSRRPARETSLFFKTVSVIEALLRLSMGCGQYRQAAGHSLEGSITAASGPYSR